MQRHPHHQDPLDAQYDRLSRSALDAYRAKQAAFTRVLARFSQWSIDHEPMHLHFTGTEGQAQTFQITPIGTYLPAQEDWAWAWGNDAFPEACRNSASRIKGLREMTGYGIFETPHFRTSLNEVDALCAFSLQVLNGMAVFKVKDETPWVYYVVEPALDTLPPK